MPLAHLISFLSRDIIELYLECAPRHRHFLAPLASKVCTELGRKDEEEVADHLQYGSSAKMNNGCEDWAHCFPLNMCMHISHIHTYIFIYV